jgi:signal transduction histidine kinase
LANLLDNAIRHTNTGGMVHLQLRVHEHGYLIRVCDNGCGIHSDDLPYIFTPRFRARNSRHDQLSHNGLGLAISAKLCQLLSIDLSVQSQLGAGADFRLQVKT